MLNFNVHFVRHLNINCVIVTALCKINFSDFQSEFKRVCTERDLLSQQIKNDAQLVQERLQTLQQQRKSFC